VHSHGHGRPAEVIRDIARAKRPHPIRRIPIARMLHKARARGLFHSEGGRSKAVATVLPTYTSGSRAAKKRFGDMKSGIRFGRRNFLTTVVGVISVAERPDIAARGQRGEQCAESDRAQGPLFALPEFLCAPASSKAHASSAQRRGASSRNFTEPSSSTARAGTVLGDDASCNTPRTVQPHGVVERRARTGR